jgi:hypothetical protein
VSWLTLLLATAGVLLAAVAVASILLGVVSRASLSFAAAAVAVVVFLTFFAPGIHAALSFLNGERLMYRGLPPEKAREKCLLDGGHADQVGFLEFVRRVVPGQTRDVMVGGYPVDAACLSFVLLPRLLEAGAQNATWAIFTSGVPANWAGMIVPGTVRTFRPGQLVARLRR